VKQQEDWIEADLSRVDDSYSDWIVQRDVDRQMEVVCKCLAVPAEIDTTYKQPSDLQLRNRGSAQSLVTLLESDLRKMVATLNAGDDTDLGGVMQR
jgi:hypothetical protein